MNDTFADPFEEMNIESENQNIPEELLVLPVRGVVVYPNLPVPLAVGKSRSIRLINEAVSQNQALVVVGIRPEAQAKGEPEVTELYPIGTLVQVLKVIKIQQDYYQVIVQGVKRFAIKEYTQHRPFLKARGEFLEEDRTLDQEVEALGLNLRRPFERYAQLEKIESQVDYFLHQEQHPSDLGYFIAANIHLDVAQQQEILETSNLKDRLRTLLVWLMNKIETLMLSQEIEQKLQEQIGKIQREAMLRERLKTIQKELGMEEGETSEMEELRQRVQEANLTEEARRTAESELKRLARMSPASAEYTVSRTYLDWILDLPWQAATADALDIDRAQEILDADHYGLERAKRRILEYLAVRKLKNDMRGPVLCFVGPPGVGKTSLGQSIARSLGRKFVRISLGGMRDEAEIRGHRRTYVGALPGRIIQGLKKAGFSNPVFMLDEIDKLGMDFRGDPASALLEVLDPEQNHSFSDHYLEIPFDLSKVMFITTANVADPIPPALKDRMEVLEIPGYTLEEKLLIAKRHLVPKEIEEHGLTPEQIIFSDEALREIISSYTREAGVRNLRREIAAVCRRIARDIASSKIGRAEIDRETVAESLGPKRYLPETETRSWGPGLSTGLAWTPVGGEILFVEASRMKGGKNLILTGQLGEVMKESATAALSYIRSHAESFGLDEEFFQNTDIHVHVPAGAIPKDGPSAGVAMFCALISLLTQQTVRKDIAMTGEITLRGDVLPVGGIKEKVLAAKRAGLSMVILPYLNRKDLADIPTEMTRGMHFEFVHSMDEVLAIALPTLKQRRAPTCDPAWSETFGSVDAGWQN